MTTRSPLDGFMQPSSLQIPTPKWAIYTSIHAQLLSAPPYACAAIFTIAVGFLADRTGQRGVCNISFSLIRVVGFAMLLGSQRSHVNYAGTFLGALGIYPCNSNTIGWTTITEGVYKRGIVLESSSAGVISIALLVATYTSTLPNSRTGMRQSWLIRLPACLQEAS
jgi:hypothetical protein